MPATCVLPITHFAPAAAASSSSTTTTDTLVLTGIISAPEFYKARSILQTITTKCPSLNTRVNPLPETAFTVHRHALRALYPSMHPQLHPNFLIELHTTRTTLTRGANKVKHVDEKTSHTLMTRKEMVEFARARGVEIPDEGEENEVDEEVRKLAEREYEVYLEGLPGPVVSIDFWHVGVKAASSKEDGDGGLQNQPLGPRLLVELFGDSCPKTVQHFLRFVRGDGGSGGAGKYEKSLVTRIVKGGWMECGEILDDAGHPIQIPPLEDENFIHPHNPYTLSYLNSSKGPHTATTPFLITLAPMPAFDKRYVAFGRVLQGLETLHAVNAVQTSHERPAGEVWIQEIKVWESGK
ncbi:putative inactive peptidyl-prolyl cis-trans isomerase-like 6 [Geranomyces variabilis]|uniref:peptidylprolyl isomerase n=1 Tax=Geranomyces variabilis TaxID=109894 RepID=A0AAD5XML2_9FUNG|nr:putative inactive peptidyl-prolyl cis-trans isomerase-like 6 [Geranomyces variabilis]